MLAFLLAPFYLLFNLYLFRRIMGWVRAWFPWFRKRKHWAVSAALYAFFALSFVLAFPLPTGRLKRALMLIGNYWLGVLLYLLLAVLLADGLRLLLVHGLKLRSLRSARMHRIAGCLCAAAILVTSVGGVINARVVRVTPYEVTVNKSAGSMESMKVVLLADLHLGYNVGLAQMERMVARVNEQDADAVVIAGDIFDNAWEAVEEPEQIAAVLRGIRSRYGVYAVYGNHDIEEPILAGFTFRGDGKKQSSPEMDAFLASANIRLLRDEAVLLGGEVYLYGRPDAQRPGRGIEVRNIPVGVFYPEKAERVSHFRPGKDFTRISILNTLLVLGALLFYYPWRFLRSLTRENIRRFVADNITRSKDSNPRLAASIGLGVFFGIAPLWGYQMIAAAVTAHFTRLNKAVAVITSNISIPPMIPFILYGSYWTGAQVLQRDMPLSLSDITLERVAADLVQYIVGSFTMAAVCGAAATAVGYALLVLCKRTPGHE